MPEDDKEQSGFTPSSNSFLETINARGNGGNKKKIIIISAAILLILSFLLSYFLVIKAPSVNEGETSNAPYVVPQNNLTATTILKLKSSGYIKSAFALEALLAVKGSPFIDSGGYDIKKGMNIFEIADILSKGPRLVWVKIPEGLRKEEIAKILAKELSWNDSQVNTWITVDTNTQSDYKEGVYFPDTYLLPKDESPKDIGKRLISHFQEKFLPYAASASKNNIKWTTALTLASIIQREAAGKDDMSLISGILWNRLDQGMKLQVDATIQYARGATGDRGNGFWSPISIDDKNINSPYNTYLFKGLPPHPIDNPGLDAINAAINPEKTSCLFYLHDSSRKIHCAKTYEEHQKNIAKYL